MNTESSRCDVCGVNDGVADICIQSKSSKTSYARVGPASVRVAGVTIQDQVKYLVQDKIPTFYLRCLLQAGSTRGRVLPNPTHVDGLYRPNAEKAVRNKVI